MAFYYLNNHVSLVEKTHTKQNEKMKDCITEKESINHLSIINNHLLKPRIKADMAGQE